MDKSINFILNESVFKIPCTKKTFMKIPESKEDLFNDLLKNHEYIVKSKVRNEVFQSFLNYWKDDSLPQINSDNIMEYYQLNLEFGLLEDYFQEQRSQNPEFSINFLIGVGKNASSFKKLTEKNISIHLDDYINDFSEKLSCVDISSLYNIFFDPERKLENHDKAYKFIVNSALKKKKDFFALLESIDAQKIQEEENKKDMFKIVEHLHFVPKNFDIVFSEIIQKNENLNNQLNELSAQNENLKNQLSELNAQNENLNNQLNELNAQNENLNNQLNELNTQNENLNKQIKKLKPMIFSYTGKVQSVNLLAGTYKLEVWGAQGGSYNTELYGGKGGYSTGNLTIMNDTTLYIYVGGQGDNCTVGKEGGWNGGGSMNNHYGVCPFGGGGGGATDISLHGVEGSTDWNTRDHLYSRIIVAGGGSSASYGSLGGNQCGGFGGGESGGGKLPASQTKPGMNGSFGIGANEEGSGGAPDGAAGGGWYGGGAIGLTRFEKPSGGGSGYVYTSSTKSNYPNGCLLNDSFYLINAFTKAGNTSFPNFEGNREEIGHCGNGAAKISFICD